MKHTMCDSSEEVQSIKCMLVGDSSTGKTHLFKKFIQQPIPSEYVPTVFDTCNLQVETSGGCKLNLAMWDSAGQQDYDNIRPISYAHTDCFIVCYSVNDRKSFENVYDRWLPEIVKHGDGPIVPLILASTKCDLASHRENESDNVINIDDIFVNDAEGKELQSKIEAKALFSCSSSLNMRLSEMFQMMVDLAHSKKENETKPPNPIWKFNSSTIVVTGDIGVGKSSLIKTFIQNRQNLKNDTRLDKLQEYYYDVVNEGCEYFLRIIEIPNLEIELMNTLIEQVDVLVCCYAINDPFSFQSVELFFKGKFKEKLKKLPVMLIGIKSDLKDESICAIPTVDGEQLKQQLELTHFIECSTKTLENVSQVFGAILDAIK